jgi:class 3 adenylate cyclase
MLMGLFALVQVVVAPYPRTNQTGAIASFLVVEAVWLGYILTARRWAGSMWLIFVLGSLPAVPAAIGIYFLGPDGGPVYATAGYMASAGVLSVALNRRLMVYTVVFYSAIYAVVLAFQPVTSEAPVRWLVMVVSVTAVALLATRIAEWIFAVQDQLDELNRDLEGKVRQQVAEVERLDRLRRFLPPVVADAVVGPNEATVLAPHRREIAVVFIDLRGFSRFTADAEPEEVIAALRAYHETVGEVLEQSQATVGPIQGDGMMAYFNDPLPCDDPPGRAAVMALELKPRLDAFADRWAARGYELSYGIGFAFGYATLGMVGYHGRQEYAPVGTVANLASRLCDHAAPGQVLTDQRTRASLSADFEAEALDPIEVKGFAQPVRVVAISRRAG